MRFLSVCSLSIATALLVGACSDDDDASTVGAADDASTPQSDTGTPSGDHDGGDGHHVSLSFEARVGDDPFSCATPAAGMGSTGATIEPLDFRVYVHDVQLVGADGHDVPLTLTNDGKWQYEGVALLDFEDKSGTCANGTVDVNTHLEGTTPAGKYTGIKFKVGVPFALNHADVATAPSPLNLSSMFWSWNGGYKFARIDGRSPTPDAGANTDAGMDMDGGGMDMDAGTSMDGGMDMDGGGMMMDPSVFSIHLGSTECEGDPAKGGAVTACARPNVGQVVLTGFDPTTTKILVDYKALVAGSDLTMDMGGAPGCMSGATDPECPNVLSHLGVDPTTGQPDATKQALFRVE